MKVPFIFGPGDLRLCDVERPRAGPRDVVVQVAAAGICGSDLGYVAQGGVTGPTKEPVPLGHELAGIVVEAGDAVRTVAVGDRVVLNPLVNMIGNGSAEGGFAERLLVRDVAGRPGSLLALPDAISLEDGALIEPLAVAAHAVNRMAAKPGDKVAIFGAGPIGLCAIVVLHHRGIDDVVAFDPSPFRRARAEALGVGAAIDPVAVSARAALIDLHGAVPLFRGEAPATTHYLEASGAPLLAEIVGMARGNATICIASVHKQPASLDCVAVMSKELTLVGTLGYPSEIPDVIEMLRPGTIDLAPLVSHRFAGDDVLAAFATAQQADRAAKVLVRYET